MAKNEENGKPEKETFCFSAFVGNTNGEEIKWILDSGATFNI